MKGKISQWIDAKGFGFIIPDDGSEKIFFHISSIKTRSLRPKVGDKVLFDAARDSKNRLKAKMVVIEDANISSHYEPINRPAPVIPIAANSPNYFLWFACCVVALAIGFYFYSSPLITNEDLNPLFESAAVPELTEDVASTNEIAQLPDRVVQNDVQLRPSVREIYEASQSADNIIRALYRNGQSNVQVTGVGSVDRILSDDNDGSRHQRFILKLGSGQTLLITHNIDIAPRINSLSRGDKVMFNGEYEWNSQGGLVHWTHHDPNGQHVAGSLTHQEKIYQ